MSGKVSGGAADQQPGLQPFSLIQRTIDQSHDPLALVDTHLVYRAVNRAYTDLCGLAPGALLNRAVADVLDPAFFADQVAPQLRRCLDGEEVVFSARLALRDGVARWQTLRFVPWPDDGGDSAPRAVIIHALGIAEYGHPRHDLTRLFDLMPFLFAVAGVDGVIHHVNPAWQKVLGYDAAALVGTRFFDLSHPDDLAALHARVAALAAGIDVSHHGVRFRARDGSFRNLVWSATVAPASGLLYALALDETAQQKTAAALSAAHQRLELVLDAIDSPVYVADMETYELLYINSKVREQFGEVVGQLCYLAIQRDQTGPCTFCTNPSLIDATGEPGPPVIWDAENTALGGWYHCIDRAVRWDDGRLVRIEIAVDITERRATEAALARRAELEATLAVISNDLSSASPLPLGERAGAALAAMRRCLGVDCSVLLVFDPATGNAITHPHCHTDATTQLPADIAPAQLTGLLSAWRAGGQVVAARDADMPAWMPQELAVIGLGGSQAVLLTPFRFGGDLMVVVGFAAAMQARRWSEDECYVCQMLCNLIGNATGRQRTLDALREHRDQLERAAFNDPLTGLGNRRLLIERMHEAQAIVERTHGVLAVCFLDLDEFKPINDTFGHEVGDRLLVQVAARLQAGIRPNDTVARWGGDEFALLLTGMPSAMQCLQTLERLLLRLREPYRVDAHDLRVTASIGVSLYPEHGRAPAVLTNLADKALYLAKREGRNRVRLYRPASGAQPSSVPLLPQQLAEAIDCGQLCLHYQPIFNMRHGRVVGVEALLRWQHPTRGLLPAADFLPALEGHDLFHRLDLWVIRTGLQALEGWASAGFSPQLCLNVSSRTLLEPGFIEEVRGLLDARPAVCQGDVILEVREHAVLRDIDALAAVLRRAEVIGLAVALDEVGQGHASFANLRDLRARTFKLGPSLVRGMLDDQGDLSLIASVLGVARAFDRNVIAGGLERTEQGSLLLDLGCELAQGYGIARPMAADALVDWAASYQPPVQWSHAPVGWRAADVPLLLLDPQHRQWLARCVAALQGEPGAALPPLHESDCALGRWVDADGERYYRDHPAFAGLRQAHADIHAKAQDLVRRRDAGETITPLALDALQQLHHVVIAQLNLLRHEVLARRR